MVQSAGHGESGMKRERGADDFQVSGVKQLDDADSIYRNS